MLDINAAEKSLTFLASQLLGKNLDIQVTRTNGSISASAGDISHLLGIKMFKSLTLGSFRTIKDVDSDSYEFTMHYNYSHLNSGNNGCECFTANLNPDGSIRAFSRAEDMGRVYGHDDPFFKKTMTTQKMKDEFFYWVIRSSEKHITDILDNSPFYVDSKDYSGRTAMHYAAEKNKLKIATLLLDRNADINIRNDNDETPLYTAIYNYQLPCAKLLMEQGANLITNGKGETVIDLIEKHLDANEPEAKRFSEWAISFVEQRELNKHIQKTGDSEPRMDF